MSFLQLSAYIPICPKDALVPFLLCSNHLQKEAVGKNVLWASSQVGVGLFFFPSTFVTQFFFMFRFGSRICLLFLVIAKA